MKIIDAVMALCFTLLVILIAWLLTGCATLTEQDQQRREIIELMHSDNAQWRAIRDLQGGDPEGWE